MTSHQCGSCRDTGRWSNGIECPVCGGWVLHRRRFLAVLKLRERELDETHLFELLDRFADEHPVMMAFIGLALVSVADLCREKEQPA